MSKSKAYSYIRFSTPEQALGDSLRRQYESALAYATTHDLELDTELRYEDKGVSGFSGANIRKGALGQFLAAIDVGVVQPGSYLLVENLDRMSRQDPWEAMPLFQQIINAGITIVTLQDGRVWSQAEMKANPMRILESLFVMIRANEESATKSRRLRSAWSNKRANAKMKRLTKVCPAWLEPSDNGFTEIAERANTVRDIFQMSLEGTGQHKIAETLNRQGVPTFGRSELWHRSYISKILKNPAVVGVFVPHTLEVVDNKKQRKPEEPIEGYYPAIVDRDTFRIVSGLRRGGAAPRGRHAGSTVRNPLAGLAKCPKCGHAMTRVTKGSSRRAGKPYLVCTKAKSGGGCQYKAVPLEPIEMALVEQADRIVGEVPPAQMADGLAKQAASIEARIDELTEEAKGLLSAVGRTNSRTAVEELSAVETAIDEQRENLREIETQIIESRGPLIAGRLEQAKATLAEGAANETNAVLKQLLTKVIVDYERGFLELLWRHGGESDLRFDARTVFSRNTAKSV